MKPIATGNIFLMIHQYNNFYFYVYFIKYNIIILLEPLEKCKNIFTYLIPPCQKRLSIVNSHGWLNEICDLNMLFRFHLGRHSAPCSLCSFVFSLTLCLSVRENVRGEQMEENKQNYAVKKYSELRIIFFVSRSHTHLHIHSTLTLTKRKALFQFLVIVPSIWKHSQQKPTTSELIPRALDAHLDNNEPCNARGPRVWHHLNVNSINALKI